MSTQLPADWESRTPRMLDADEVGPQFMTCPLLQGIEWRAIQRERSWAAGWRGCEPNGEYRTRYTRAELRAARGLEPEAVAAPVADASELDRLRAENRSGDAALLSVQTEAAALRAKVAELESREASVMEGIKNLTKLNTETKLVSALTAERAINTELVGALTKCAAKFREYEEIHNAKDRACNSTISVSKATRNAMMAEMAEAALVKADAMKGARL